MILTFRNILSSR